MNRESLWEAVVAIAAAAGFDVVDRRDRTATLRKWQSNYARRLQQDRMLADAVTELVENGRTLVICREDDKEVRYLTATLTEEGAPIIRERVGDRTSDQAGPDFEYLVRAVTGLAHALREREKHRTKEQPR